MKMLSGGNTLDSASCDTSLCIVSAMANMHTSPLRVHEIEGRR